MDILGANPEPRVVPLNPAEPGHIAAVAAIWNAACGPELAITERVVRYNLQPSTGGVQAGRLALIADRPAGFVLASALPAPGDPSVSPPNLGWVDAIAVLPEHQRQGLGTALLAWAEEWLAGQGCNIFLLGGSLRHFAPGLPAELGTEPFFRGRGYRPHPGHEYTWDVARSLRDYVSPPSAARAAGADIRPASPGDETALLAFLRRAFPGRWRYEFEEFLREGGRISDYMLLWTGQGVDGFCQLTFEDSLRPLHRYFMHRLPRPWGQLGPIGVSQEWRGQGYGAALLDAGLRRLQAQGVNGCVIDWTDLLEFYGKFGFRPYRQYVMLGKAR
jgi:predicted N-acetyltransferase YhbS